LILTDLFGKPSSQLVGLDFSANNIKLLSISGSKSAIQVENFSISPLPPTAIVKGEIKDYELASEALKTAFIDANVKSKCVALSIPRSLAIVKTILINNRLSSTEINSRAWVEANRNFPELIGNICLDYAILGPSSQDSSQLELMLVACRKDQITPYLELLRLASLTPKIVDLSSYALERALSVITKQASGSGAIALLNLDINLSTLIVVQNNNLIYAHDESYNGDRLIDLLRKTNQQQPEGQAGKQPQEQVLEQPQEQPKSQEQVQEKPQEQPKSQEQTQTLQENLSLHLRHKMHLFYSSRPQVMIEKMVLSGDCALFPEIASHVQQAIGIDTVIAAPFSNSALASHIDSTKLNACAPSLMLSFGLALSEVR